MKHVLICVTGSIAAYKACDLVSQLSKDKDLCVDVLMTKSACEFVQPLSFEALLKKKVYLSTFDSIDGEIHHISLAKKADLMVMVPASANSIAKVVHGIADDLLTSTWLAGYCPKLICPAMNTHMYENPATQDNLAKAKSYGIHIMEPDAGHLACGDSGKGKLPSVNDILAEIYYLLADKPLKGQNILVSAGPTQEAIDPVRYITNHSSGKMGYAIAKQASLLGANVTLVSGPTNLASPNHVTTIPVVSNQNMADTILSLSDKQDIIIMSAAIADYRPQTIASQKIKKHDGELTLKLEKTIDILETLGKQKSPHQILCGFAMETENLIENATIKLNKKNCDMIVANSLTKEGAGFQGDTNVATLLTIEGKEPLPLMSKDALAKEILMRLADMARKEG